MLNHSHESMQEWMKQRWKMSFGTSYCTEEEEDEKEVKEEAEQQQQQQQSWFLKSTNLIIWCLIWGTKITLLDHSLMLF